MNALRKLQKFCAKGLRKVSHVSLRGAEALEQVKPHPPLQQRTNPALLQWHQANGDATLRLTYPLTPDSVVYDLGGYKGQWASDIYSKYRCKVFIFEPMPAFYDNIKNRFKSNSDIKVFPFGLASKTSEALLTIAGDASSLHSGGDLPTEKIYLRNVVDFFSEHNHSEIDLMKMNIEGAEYDLLPALCDHDFICRVKNLQVQFHDNLPDARTRVANIRAKLSKAHQLTWQYDFVWENWERHS